VEQIGSLSNLSSGVSIFHLFGFRPHAWRIFYSFFCISLGFTRLRCFYFGFARRVPMAFPPSLLSCFLHRLCFYGFSITPSLMHSSRLRFFAHGLRLSVMSKKVYTFASRQKMAASLRIPKEVRHSRRWEDSKLSAPWGEEGRTQTLLIKPRIKAVPLTSGVNPDEILPRKTRKSSHCGRVAFSFQS